MPKSIFDTGNKDIKDVGNMKVMWIYSEFIIYPDGSIKAGRHFNGVKNQKTERTKSKATYTLPKIEVDDEVLL